MKYINQAILIAIFAFAIVNPILFIAIFIYGFFFHQMKGTVKWIIDTIKKYTSTDKALK